jgi:hypothetical protein
MHYLKNSNTKFQFTVSVGIESSQVVNTASVVL